MYFQIRIKLKQTESTAGPKISVDMNFGSLILFLSPRQFHVILELANGLASPDIQDTRYGTVCCRYFLTLS